MGEQSLIFYSEEPMDKLALCNSAVMRCGSEPIASLTDTSKRALAVVSQYSVTLRELLNDSPWNFAIVRATLEEDGEAPLFGFTHRYKLPTDCVRVLELEDKVEYRVEKGYVVCDAETSINIKYVTDLADISTYSGSFCKAFVLKLSEDICYVLVQSASLQQAISAEAERYLRKARSMNSQEGTPEARYPEEYTSGIRR